MAKEYYIRRDRSALADGTLFGRRKRGIARWKLIGWLAAVGFLLLILWQMRTVRPAVMAAFGSVETPLPSAGTYAQRAYAAYLSGNLEIAIDNYCLAVKGVPGKIYADPRCAAPDPTSEEARKVNLDIGYELVRVLVYRSYDDRRVYSYTKDAEAWGRILADAYPKSARARAIFAFALTNNEKAEIAIPEGLNAISLDPNYGDGFAYLSLASSSASRLDNARTYGEKAVQLAPDSVDAHIAYGTALFYTGSNQGAEQEYKTALGVNPRLTFPYFQLAAFYLNRANARNAPTGMQEAAVAMYDEVLKLDNKNIKAYTRKCAAYFNIGENTKALENCKTAVGLDKDFTEARKWQGQVWYNKRDYEDAIDAFAICQKQEEQSVKEGKITRAQMFPECWYLQGLAQYLLGYCDKAYPLFNEVLAFATSETAIRLTGQGIAGCASKNPDYIPPTPIPTATPRPAPIR